MLSQKEVEEIVEKAFIEANKTCTEPWILAYERPLDGTNVTVHQIFSILAGVACTISSIISVYLIVKHLLNWGRPQEQKHYCRIIFFTVVESHIAFFSVLFYDAANYLDPVSDLYEAFAIVSFFFLFQELVYQDGDVAERSQLLTEKEKKKKIGQMSLKRFRVTWWMVFQIAALAIPIFVAFELTFTLLCPLDSTRSKLTIFIDVFQGISLAIAIMGIIAFEKKMRPYLKGHRPLSKFFTFKSIVILGSLQKTLFSILEEAHVFVPPKPYYISFNDFGIGLAPLILAWELVGQALMLHWAFSPQRFVDELRQKGQRPLKNPFMALCQTWSPHDVIAGLFMPSKLKLAASKLPVLTGDSKEMDNKGSGYHPIAGFDEDGHA